MKNKILQFGLLSFAAVMLFACEKKVEVTTTATEAVDKDKVKTEIQTMENTYAAAMEKKDIEGIMVYYADDAQSFSNEQPGTSGKAAIKADLQKELDGMPAGAKVKFETKDVSVSSDGMLVVENGAYTMTDSTATKKMTGNFLVSFEKRDGKYVAVREMVQSDMPKDKK